MLGEQPQAVNTLRIKGTQQLPDLWVGVGSRSNHLVDFGTAFVDQA